MNGPHRRMHIDVWIELFMAVSGTDLMSTCKSEVESRFTIDRFYGEAKL